VLRALEQMRVPIDMVAGASMGAVVGGAYASGRSVEELEQFVRATDWPAILADRPPRDDLPFRRRGRQHVARSRADPPAARRSRRRAAEPPGIAVSLCRIGLAQR
jgi:NTE family protein